MPTTTYSSPTSTAAVAIEGRAESASLHIRGHSVAGSGESVLTPAGIVAVLATLSTYYSGLSATNLAALAKFNNGQWLKVAAASIDAAVLPADHATVAASLATNVKAAGNTAHG